jgi:hypothetical protein
MISTFKGNLSEIRAMCSTVSVDIVHQHISQTMSRSTTFDVFVMTF